MKTEWKRNGRCLLAGLLCAALLAGCMAGEGGEGSRESGGVQAEEPSAAEADTAEETPLAVPVDSLEAVLAIANERHRAYRKPQLELEEYIVGGGGGDFDTLAYGLDMSGEISYDGGVLLTPEQAEEDLEVLFSALATTYGPYHYFGGDEAFGAAREAILESCRARAETGELAARDVTGFIRENMGFIRDGHFQINFERLHQLEVAYLYTGALFDRTADGGYLRRDGRMLSAVEGWPDLDSLMRMTLTDAGEIAYCPVVLKALDEEMTLPDDLTLRFADGGSEAVSPDPWEMWYDEDEERIQELSYKEGFPVAFARNMGFDEAQDDVNGKAFLAYAEEMKGASAAIVDLRSNGGGNGVLPLKWLGIWTGETVTTNSVGLQYFSEQDLADFLENTENSYYNTYEDFTEVLHMRPVSEQYMSISDVPDVFVENDSLLVVLTGKYTASAAEYFADAAMNVENVLLVGENTYGAVVSNAYINIQLPHSGTIVCLGCNLMFYPDEVREYSGILPDIWVNGDAEEKVIRMLQNLLPAAE